MEVIFAENIGYCKGIENAVKKTEENLPAYTTGNILHNSEVMNNLKENGLKIVGSLEEVPRGSKIIVRSHGEVKEYYESAKKMGLEIIDTTCPFVKKIQKLAEEYSKRGYKIFIAGDENHPEVQGIISYCNNNYEVIDGDFEGECEKGVLIFQTTFSYEKMVRMKVPKNVEVIDTICRATKDRQNEIKNISDDTSLVIIVGDKNSSNSNKLFELSKKNSIFIKDYKEIENYKNILKSDMIIKVFSGASVPKANIERVKMALLEKEDL